ncbi:MAG: BMC domain-containing protein [Myxococcales bacterium]|nr:BMC domain-containing protein [Myxococcales bacterium]
MSKPALAFVELFSIARGMLIVDQMIKKAPIELLASGPVSSGKFTILVAGDVAEIDESYRLALALAPPHLAGSVFLPQVASAIIPGLRGDFVDLEADSLAIVETRSQASTIVSCDAALKGAEVQLLDLRIYKRLGGKGYFVVSGPLDQVEAAVEAATARLEAEQLLQSEIIARPHDESWDHFYRNPRLRSVRDSHRYLDD